MPVPVSQLQNDNPTAVIELFELELNTALHGNARTAGWQPWSVTSEKRYGK